VRRPSSASGASAGDSVLKVYDLPSTMRRLDAVWDAHYPYAGVDSPKEDRLADAVWPVYAACPAEPGAVQASDGQPLDAAAASPPRPAVMSQGSRQLQAVPPRSP
jgi:hypothetical protein